MLTAAPSWSREHTAVRNVIPDRQFGYAADERGGWLGGGVLGAAAASHTSGKRAGNNLDLDTACCRPRDAGRDM